MKGKYTYREAFDEAFPKNVAEVKDNRLQTNDGVTQILLVLILTTLIWIALKFCGC